ncbi:hypothetical protein D3C80_2132690 [compost metagenome]
MGGLQSALDREDTQVSALMTCVGEAAGRAVPAVGTGHDVAVHAARDAITASTGSVFGQR